MIGQWLKQFAAAARVFVLVPAMVFGLSACEGQPSNIHLDDDGALSVPVPQPMRQIAALSSNQLEIQVSVNGTVSRFLPVSDTDEVISTVVNMPANQNNEITIAWFAIIGSQKVILADFTEIVTPGATVLDVLNYNNTGERFDADSDGRSNLSEAIDNRNLLSQFDMEVPLLNSFGGPVAQITDDGVDGDTSGGGQIETDENSTFRLRHNGTQLIVNVCGNDQTLIGDNSADGGNGQYWHDDTVFLYIDGSDNDSQTYDQVDDFQFAFVRSTEEFIISKAPPQFCPTNDCVQFSFFQNSTECEYELSVTLPLNDLNIALDSPVGFDVEIVDDDDGDLREGSSAWIGFNDQSNLDPSTFGTIRLN